MEQHTEYTRVIAEDRNEYICPIEAIRSKTTIAVTDLNDCVEAEVVGRYIGHLRIIDHR